MTKKITAPAAVTTRLVESDWDGKQLEVRVEVSGWSLTHRIKLQPGRSLKRRSRRTARLLARRIRRELHALAVVEQLTKKEE